MELLHRRSIKATARESLAAAPYDPRKLIMIHTGITIAVSLLGTTLNFILAKQIENTGGLGGLGMRSMLSTIQSVLQVLVAVLLPFWEAGYCYATMRIARGQEAAPDSLLQGFRRFRPLLRVKLMQGVLYCLAGMACFFLGYYIFMLTPLSDPLYAIIETVNIDPTMLQTELLLDDATMLALADAYTPMLLIWLVLFLVAGTFLFYRFRFATYLALDYPQMRAMEMLRFSTYQLRGHTSDLIKLDVEGAEMATLNGARKVLKEQAPHLVLSLYHRTDDLFQLPETVHELLPNHRLYLRRVPCIPLWDLTLYAVRSE